MDSAFVRNATNGAPVSAGQVPFIRLPVPGESLQLGNVAWSVVSVVHGWGAGNVPMAEVRVAPPGWHSAAPFQP
jgi:hypothetical protein